MELKLMNPKGTKDYFKNEQGIRKKIRNTLIEVFELYGCEEMETPALSYYDVLSSKYAGGAEILKEVYRLSDQGDRELALRYDLTIPFARVIGMNPQLKMPFKRYEIGKVFRDGPVKTGRLREFVQCDVDIVGVKSVLAEVELISMIVDVFNRLDIDIYISLNNRKLLTGLLNALNIADDKINNVILTLDKIEKISFDDISKELLQIGIDEKTITTISELYNSTDQLTEIEQNYSNNILAEGLDELNQIISILKKLEIAGKVRINPFLARGLDIYTGTVYEVFLTDNSISSSIASGGRYDNIIGAFLQDENEYPAVGVSFGLDVIYQALKEKELEIKSSTEVYIIPINTTAEVFMMANFLRKEGIKVEVQLTEQRLKKSLDYANKRGIPNVIIFGEDELNNFNVKIKNMQEGTEKIVELPYFLGKPHNYIN